MPQYRSINLIQLLCKKNRYILFTNAKCEGTATSAANMKITNNGRLQ